MSGDRDLLDTKAIARLLGYTSAEAAAALCRSGRLKTARKFGNAWVAERGEVLEYQRSAAEYIHNRVAERARRVKRRADRESQ